MRVALLALTPELFVELAKACKSGPPRRFEVAENPLPDDAEIVAVSHNSDPLRLHYGTVLLVIKSEVFVDVPEGNYMPMLPPIVFKTVNDEGPPKARAAS